MPADEPVQRAPISRHRILGFQDLMPRRVDRILLVSSAYDHFILAEDGQLTERVLSEFLDLGLRHTPDLMRVSTAEEALAAAFGEWPHDLIIATPHLGDMNAVELARLLRVGGRDTPVVLLGYDARELTDFAARNDMSQIERAFLWQGDVRILLAIVKYIEDKLNLAHDAGAGVPLILVVEDNVRYYSSFLPMIYTELLRHSQALIAEGVNLSHKVVRMRARPKLVLASRFEEAWGTFTAYMDGVLGVISDIEFEREGGSSRSAGVDLAVRVREAAPDMPIVLQSSRPENAALAQGIGATFLRKGSPLLLNDLRRCMVEEFGFGDFVFRLPDGREVGRARDLRRLEELLQVVPAESLAYHGERNHFSKWLRARTEFDLATRLRPRRISDYPDIEALRRDLVAAIAEYRRGLNLGAVADFDRRTFDGQGDFHRIGGGSMGGKARGLAFLRRLLAGSDLAARFPQVRIGVPACVVVATDVFDQFLDENALRDFAVASADDDEIRERITAADFPSEARSDLAAFLAHVHDPLAVRSSSLLEDSHYQPFTGVYATYMLPNLHPLLEVRLRHLLQAVQRVYASTFSSHTKAHLQATPYRLEEEKMAVILQRLVGSERGGRFYPDFAGVARSHNFYPTPPIEAEDGVVAVALGLGRTVVEGGNCLRFSPRHPRHLMSFSSVDDVLRNSQREFWALALREAGGASGLTPMSETRFDLGAAEADGALALLGSTYSHDNHAVYDGLSRAGLRVVTFAPILKHAAFPLPEIVRTLLDLAQEGVAAPVEIEFAVDLARREFGFLQVRPLTAAHDEADVDLGDVPAGRLVCHSTRVLGHGRVEGVHDAVVVDAGRFERGRSREVAQDLAQLNARLVQSGVAYLLIGVGRWGSRDPWLGIPVTWDQISGARAIVEAGFRDLRVAPSQGSHFFQNITSFNVAYFTVNPDLGEGFVDWDWLRAQPAVHESGALRHLRFDEPIVVRMNGPRHEGVILKPGS
jgi:CheY-like chemotaxis protein